MIPSGQVAGAAFIRARIRQAPGSCLRLVRFRGGDILYDRQDEMVLSMGVSASFGLEYAGGGRRGSVTPMINRFGFLPPGERFRIAMQGDCFILQFVVPRGVLTDWLSEDLEIDGERTVFAPAHGVDDPNISRLIWSAWRLGPAHENEMLRAAAARLHFLFSPGARSIKFSRGGLSAHKLRRVVELIEDDPTRRLSVDDLAREVTTSPYHFAHQFRLATGQAPHQFIIDRRLSRAVHLLAETKLTSTEVALRCGFAQASHLSRQMRRVFGSSPTGLRRAMRV